MATTIVDDEIALQTVGIGVTAEIDTDRVGVNPVVQQNTVVRLHQSDSTTVVVMGSIVHDAIADDHVIGLVHIYRVLVRGLDGD